MAVVMVANSHRCLNPSLLGKQQPTVDMTLSVDHVAGALSYMAARWRNFLESKGTVTHCAVRFIHHQT